MEEEDLVEYYHKSEGDMRALIENIPLSSNDDIPRFIGYFETMVAEGELPEFKAFAKTKNKVRLLKDEKEEFEAQQKQDMGALVAAIRNKAGRSDFIAQMEAKFSFGQKKKAEGERKPAKPKRKVEKK